MLFETYLSDLHSKSLESLTYASLMNSKPRAAMTAIIGAAHTQSHTLADWFTHMQIAARHTVRMINASEIR